MNDAPNLMPTAWTGPFRFASGPACAAAVGPGNSEVDHEDAESAVRTQCAGCHVLLVEDCLINQEVTRELLQSAGLRVDSALDGEEAVRLVQTRDYDLILMDVRMPGMDGLEATRAIRALPACRQIPIIAMTADGHEEDRQACLAAGMDDFLAKPVEPEILYAALLKWLPPRPMASPH